MLTVYLVCLTYLLLGTDPVQCKPDYLFNSELQGWLKLHMIPSSWAEAALHCHYEGAVLASPLDEKLTNALHSTMTKFGLEIGLIFLGTGALYTQGDYVSIEGVPLSDQDIRWFPYGADRGECVIMVISGREHYMLTAPCNMQLPYICYRPLGNKTLNECGTFDDEYHYNQRTGSCYKVHLEKHNWQFAQFVCTAEGGHLVILNDEVEAGIVKDMFPIHAETTTQDPWEQIHIGLKSWDVNIWFTVDGQEIDDVYNQWALGQPDNRLGEPKIGTILRSGKLYDADPAKRNMFVCEKSPHAVRYESPTFGWRKFSLL